MSKSSPDLDLTHHLDNTRHLGVHRAAENCPLNLQPEQGLAARTQEGRAGGHGGGVFVQTSAI